MKKRRPFPRMDYAALEPYRPERATVDVDLSDNTNLWGVHPAAARALAEAATEDLTRYPDPYADALRRAAAARWGVGPGNVCTGCGADHLLDLALRAACDAGGTVACPAPTFAMVDSLARSNGRALSLVDWGDALADPSALLQGDPAVVYLCRPNNPTGLLAPAEWVRRLLDAAGADGPLVVLDEAYAEFAPREESFVREAAARSRLLVVRTLSIAYGLAGLRVGVAVGSPEVVRELDKARGPFMVSTLAQAAAVAALEDTEGWTERTVDEAIQARERLHEALEARGHAPLPSDANFLLVPVGDGGALRWAKALLDQGVAVRPFPATSGAGDCIRVTVGPWPLMERFLAALDAVHAAERKRDGGVTVEVEPERRAGAS